LQKYLGEAQRMEAERMTKEEYLEFVD